MRHKMSGICYKNILATKFIPNIYQNKGLLVKVQLRLFDSKQGERVFQTGVLSHEILSDIAIDTTTSIFYAH